ncbi:MAG: zf-HC2 domain-containing protein [Phycisphaerales bacterium]|nr:zf-HC2 domain-containing protein [Phycisphaerales bacterium]
MNGSAHPDNRPDPQPTQSGPATSSGKPACEKLGLGMTCHECVDFLLDYVDGALGDEQKFVFESHLAFCPDCTTYVRNYRQAAALTAGLNRSSRPLPGPDVPKGLVEAILKSRKSER